MGQSRPQTEDTRSRKEKKSSQGERFQWCEIIQLENTPPPHAFSFTALNFCCQYLKAANKVITGWKGLYKVDLCLGGMYVPWLIIKCHSELCFSQQDAFLPKTHPIWHTQSAPLPVHLFCWNSFPVFHLHLFHPWFQKWMWVIHQQPSTRQYQNSCLCEVSLSLHLQICVWQSSERCEKID